VEALDQRDGVEQAARECGHRALRSALERGEIEGTLELNRLFNASTAAISFGKPEIPGHPLAKKLFSDLNKATTGESECPLTLAASFPEKETATRMAELLIASGAKVDGVGDRGGEETKAPLFEAVKRPITG
jgi:hypothetical protein